MDGTATSRIDLALKVLDSAYGRGVKVTGGELEKLKSYFEGDPAGLKIEDVAVAVIQQELQRERLSADRKNLNTNFPRRSAG